MYVGYPFQFNSLGQTATTSIEDHIRDLLEQFLFTSPGERVNRPDFGCGILQMVFEPNSPELAATLQALIQSGIARWLGNLITVRSLAVTRDDAILRVSVTYEIVKHIGQQTEQQTAIFEWGNEL